MMNKFQSVVKSYWTVFFFMVVIQGCQSTEVARPMKSICKLSPQEFVNAAAAYFRNNGCEVKSQDVSGGEIQAFRRSNFMPHGDQIELVGPYLFKAKQSMDTLRIEVYTVRDEKLGIVKSWPENSSDAWNREAYMPFVNGLRALCK
jgi:hypothetical protein